MPETMKSIELFMTEADEEALSTSIKKQETHGMDNTAMPTSEELPFLVGLPITNKKIQDFLSTLNLPRHIEIEPGDDQVFVCEHNLGIELIFEDEKNIRKRLHNYKDGELVLSCIRFYANHDGDMHPYTGKLPSGITNSMQEEDIKKILGEPSFQNSDLGTMRWDTPTISTAVRTEKNKGPLRDMSILLWP